MVHLCEMDHTHANDAFAAADLLDGCRIDRIIGLDDRISVIAARLVRHVFDVDAAFTQLGRDLRYHVGHVAIDDADAVMRARTQHHPCLEVNTMKFRG